MTNLDSVLSNRVAARLAAGELALTMQVRLVDSVEIAPIANACGFDSLYIDIEHSSFSLRQASQICIAALATGITPFVRVPNLNPEFVSRALDGGAMGVIAPHITCAADARQVVHAAKFPPLGGRSVSVGLPHLQFRQWPVAEARRILNAHTTVVAMIEGREGLENVEEIAAVDGVDILFIGANDLCADYGIDGQFDHEIVHDAFVRTIAAARLHNKHVGAGGLAAHPAILAKYVQLGARYVSAGSDLQFLMSAAQARATSTRQLI